MRISRPDGRTLAVEDRGASQGTAVVFLHSAPGSRLLDPDPWATAAARVRLVSFDRPGYGGSTPFPDGSVPTMTSHADDAAAVVEALGAGPVSLVGWSAGGIVALALAARHPDLVRSIAMIATPAHEDDVARMEDEHRAMVDALRPDPASAPAAVAEALAPIATSPKAMLDMLTSGPADDELLADPVHGPRLRTMAKEAVRQGVAGTAADIVALTIVPWGFAPDAVTVPVALWYGEDDDLVPPVHGAFWAGVLPESELHVIPGAGHLLPLVAWKQVLASVR